MPLVCYLRPGLEMARTGDKEYEIGSYYPHNRENVWEPRPRLRSDLLHFLRSADSCWQ